MEGILFKKIYGGDVMTVLIYGGILIFLLTLLIDSL